MVVDMEKWCFGRVVMAWGDEKAVDRRGWMVFSRWKVDKRTGK